MTDRELLEAAAKAAGYGRMKYFDDVPYVSHGLNGEDFFAWNPLADDGDALRLARKIGMNLILTPGGCIVKIQGVYRAEEFGDDTLAATRRAIVRAAAALAQEDK